MPRTALSIPDLYPETVSPGDVPMAAARHFRRASRQYTLEPALEIEEFDELLAFPFENGITTFVADHTKFNNGMEQSERCFQVADVDPVGAVIGVGEVAYVYTSENPYFAEKPFVSWIKTNKEYQMTRRGNLLNRLSAMRYVAHTRLDLPLYSDTRISESALRVARRLVRHGIAEEFIEGDGKYPRFRSV